VRITDGGQVQLDSLRKVARKVSDASQGAQQVYLEMIGLMDEDFHDDEWIHQDKLYAASMAGHLEEGPTANHIRLVEPLLSVAGWLPDEIKSLVHGDKLVSLVKSSGSQVLIDGVGVHLDDRRYGGWFSVTRAQELMENLAKVEHRFRQPSRSVLDLYEPDLDDARLRSLLVACFDEAVAPLSASVKRRLAIRMVDRF
jgi:hypothetical protein